MNDTPGDDPITEGLSELDREAFSRAVQAATIASTKKVAESNRVWIIVLTAAITALIVGAVAIAVVRYSDASDRAASKDNSRKNCDLITSASNLMSQFVAGDSALLTGQRFDQARIAKLHPGALKALFSDPQTRRLSEASNTLEDTTLANWNNVLVPGLRGLAAIDCGKKIK